jgi:Ni,Fe-hydrogenase III small subunit/NAD-dependent dihydropyrimidine dehydrogenase PreA subunit
MIFDIVKHSLSSPNVLVPVEALIFNAEGSRMPDVRSEALTASIARRVVDVCGTAALAIDEAEGRSTLSLDYGKCTGCGQCIEAGEGAFIAAGRVACGVGRQALVSRWDIEGGSEIVGEEAVLTVAAREIRAIVGGALNIRQVDGGSCNGCEAEIGALTNPYYDLERFGIHFVASPKHADMLLVTGPVTRNMAEAVKRTYAATPAPKLVVAVGACGCSGGIFAESSEVAGGVNSVIPVDGYIPGCPPTPAMLLTGILRVLGRRR